VLTVLRRAPDFRLLWAGQSASTIGDALVLVAVGLYVTRLTGDPSDVGLVLAAYSLPVVLFVLLGGVLADRLPRQSVMIVSDVVRCVLHALLALLIVTGAVQIWHMVVIGALFGTAEAFFRPAYTGLVPQTVDESDIQAAQALSGVSHEVAEILGPALATALVLGVGGAAAFAVDAATFAFSALLLSRIRTRERGERAQSATVLVELREGWFAVRERAWVWATVLAFSASLLVALTPFFVLGASVAHQVYGSDAVYGFANAAWGVGTVSGAVLGSRWKPLRPMRAAVWGAVPWPLALALFALGPPVPVAYGAMAAAGVGIGLFAVWWSTALAQRIPPHLLSRVSAWDYMGSLALVPVGYLLAGPVAEVFGAVEVMVVGGALGSAIMLLALVPRSTRRLERYDGPASPVGLGAAAVLTGAT
jgi:MFS family permease